MVYKDKEKRIEYDRQYRLKNRKKIKEYKKEYYLKNKINIKNYQKKYRQSPKSKLSHKKGDKKYKKSIKGKLVRNKANKKWEKNNPEKKKSEDKLKNLFRFGNISNSDFICALCGKQPVEKHHENYDLWYSFIPLCKKHHIGIR